MYRIKPNVIFDFYGTLVDIHTDEEKMSLWNAMKDYYRAYGADYTAEKLKNSYHLAVERETARLRKKNREGNVEIDLGRVFVRLLKDAPHFHETQMSVHGINRAAIQESDMQMLAHSDWAYSTANLFRLLSREVFAPYEDTLPVLEALKQQGCTLYILSNAQALFTRSEIEMSGVWPYMKKIYLSSDYQIRKPDPSFMQVLLKENDLKAEDCIMIGNDISSDIAIAHACHMDSVFLNTFAWNNARIQEEIQKNHLEQYCFGYIQDGRMKHLMEGDYICLNG